MILEASNIGFRYNNYGYILKNIDFMISSGERVGLLAKSGYGKSTFGKILAGHLIQSWGEIYLDKKEIPKKGFHPVQLIHQHPEKTINPRWKMKKALYENDDYNEKATFDEKVFFDEKNLETFGIRKSWLDRYPNELSGGELQRFAIARAITKNTKFLIADEITAMLDGITQAQIWHSLIEMSEKNKIGILVITHNKELAKRVCTRFVNLEEINNV